MVVLSFEFKERKMKLEGLKANFLGDSITEGHGVENLEDTYWNVLRDVVWQRPGDMALEVPELQYISV